MERQTENNFRLLLSDDASTGQSLAVGKTAAARDERITTIQRVKGSGSAARHFFEGLRDPRFFSVADENDYYLFSDQDGVWYPDRLAVETRAMRYLEARYGGELSFLVHCDMQVVDAVERKIAPSYVCYQRTSPTKWYFRQLLMQGSVTGGAMLMNHMLVRLLVTHPMPEYAVMRDHWVVPVAVAFGCIAYLDRAFYDYQQHGNNALGVKKDSALSEIRRRLGLAGENFKEVNGKSEVAYHALFLQAEELQRQYGEKLSTEAGKTLDGFLALQYKTKIGKAVGILRDGFTFNLPHHTLGELLFL